MPKKFRYSYVYCLLHTIKLGILGRMCHYIQPNKHREITTYAHLYCTAENHTNRAGIYPLNFTYLAIYEKDVGVLAKLILKHPKSSHENY